MISTRGTIVYTPTVGDWFNIYLELCEVVFCFAVAILREVFTLTVQAVRFCQAWQDWRYKLAIGPVSLGFDCQQDYDDLEVVWFTCSANSRSFSVYYCRQYGWVKVSW